MQINIYRDQMQWAYLFGNPVLYSAQPIPREDVPHGWYCYDLRGTAQYPNMAYALVDKAEENHAGSVLSYLPLKSEHAQTRLVKDMLQPTGETVSLNEFCTEENIRCPETPLRHMLRPASPDEAGLFYAQSPEKDEELGAIGHVRIDFGRSGKEFWHTWWPRGPEALNTQTFRDELGAVVDDLRKGILKDLSSMRRFCYGNSGVIEGGSCCQNYGFVLETDRYIYRLRCNPTEGDYQAYLSCFDKQAQSMALAREAVIGRITFASGEAEDFTEAQEYLKAIREELPYHSTTGFRCKTLTDDPELRKAVDDIVCDFYGEENPKQIEDYGGTDMTKEVFSLDSKEEKTPVQPESGRRYTIDELLALMEPQHREDQNTIRQCIAGLTEHAALLAAKGQEEQIPELRKFCIDMAEFWGLAEDDTWEGFRKMEEQYGGAFDSAVSAARDSDYVSELGEQTRQDILDGLELYAQEMRYSGDLEQWVIECEALSEQFQAEWQTRAQINMEMGGM